MRGAAGRTSDRSYAVTKRQIAGDASVGASLGLQGE